MAQPPRRPTDVIAAGAVVTRKGGDVLLVHRPKYDDWSFPKGKLDPGEHVTTAAVREVAEETGLDIRLGPPLKPQRYRLQEDGRRVKRVYYWVGRVVGDDDVSTYEVNPEIDEVVWLALEEARKQLHYDDDRTTLEQFERFSRKSYPLVILRHGRARSRKAWTRNDRRRPLTDAGRFQARQAAPVLRAYGVSHVLTSSSTRCVATVEPYAGLTGLDMELSDDLSEEEATASTVREHVNRLLVREEASVLCTHRPVLPWVFESLGLRPRPLAPGSVFVVHHRNGEVVATEHHDVSFQ